MDEGIRRAAAERRLARTGSGIERRPERAAFRALLLGVFAIAVGAATAAGSSGGMTVSRAAEPGFGSRVLRLGMEGSDVQVLNGILTAKPYARRVSISPRFSVPTAGAVRAFQRRRGLRASGAVNKLTARQLTLSMRRAGATWYGPGMYGNQTACGQVLRPLTVGVAHRSLPCGTRVTFAYRGRYLVTRVIDRGPFASGYAWDLTNGARELLGFDYSDTIRYAVAR